MENLFVAVFRLLMRLFTPAPRSQPPTRGRYQRQWDQVLAQKIQEQHRQRPGVRFYPRGDLAVFLTMFGLLGLSIVLSILDFLWADRFIHPLALGLIGYPLGRTLWFWVVGNSPPRLKPNRPGRPAKPIKRLGKYDLLEEVGSGAFGTVYRAVDPAHPRKEWALKEMHVSSGPELEMLRESFDREQKVLSWLDHPGIVGRKEYFAEGQSLILVMEFVHGLSLRQLFLQSPQGLSIHVVLPIAEGICAALVHLHSQKPHPILFRDLKPANVMVDPLGNVKLVDFGICRVVSRQAAELFTAPARATDATEVLGVRGDTLCLGTPGYAAPEQYPDSDLECDPRADIYALGVLIWSLLADEKPPKNPDLLPALRDYSSKIPWEVQELVSRATALNREERYSSSRLMLHALQELVTKFVNNDEGFKEFTGLFEKAFAKEGKQSLLEDSAIKTRLLSVGQ